MASATGFEVRKLNKAGGRHKNAPFGRVGNFRFARFATLIANLDRTPRRSRRFAQSLKSGGRPRCFGGCSNTKSKKFLEAMAHYLDKSKIEPTAASAELSQEETTIELVERQCQACREGLIPHRHQNKSSWAKVMDSPDRPTWYRRL